MGELVLRGAEDVWGHGPGDVVVRGGTIAALGPGAAAATAGSEPRGDGGAEVVDCGGRVVLPALVEGHAHLDKTLFGGPWVPHSAGDALADRIAEERRRRGPLGLPDVDHVAALLERMVVAGTGHVRSHTDVDPEVGLRGVEAVAEAAERLAGRVDVRQVAFPQHGLVTNPGTAELLDAALAAGVAAVDGLDPAGGDRDPVRHLDVVFGLAERHGAGVDIHLHDGGTLGIWQLELIAERTRVTGLGERVTVSHAYALGQADPATQGRVAELLAAAGVTILTAAVYDFPVPPVKALRAAGVNVATGHDGIRDLWGPYGTGDMLDRAMHLAYRSTFRRDEDIELALHAATYGGARAPRRLRPLRRRARRPGRRRRRQRRRGGGHAPRARPRRQGGPGGRPLRHAGLTGSHPERDLTPGSAGRRGSSCRRRGGSRR